MEVERTDSEASHSSLTRQTAVDDGMTDVSVLKIFPFLYSRYLGRDGP